MSNVYSIDCSSDLWRRKDGFTLIELLIALLIIALISSLSVPILKVQLADNAARALTNSLKSRIEEGLANCTPYFYEKCMIIFSPGLISASTVLSMINSGPASYRTNSGDINYIQFYRTMPYVKDSIMANNLSFYAYDPVAGYSASFYVIRAVGYQGGSYYTRFFVPVISGNFDSTTRNEVYVYPAMSSYDTEFSLGTAYKLSLSGSRVSMCQISYSACPSAASGDFAACPCN